MTQMSLTLEYFKEVVLHSQIVDSKANILIIKMILIADINHKQRKMLENLLAAEKALYKHAKRCRKL